MSDPTRFSEPVLLVARDGSSSSVAVTGPHCGAKNLPGVAILRIPARPQRPVDRDFATIVGQNAEPDIAIVSVDHLPQVAEARPQVRLRVENLRIGTQRA